MRLLCCVRCSQRGSRRSGRQPGLAAHAARRDGDLLPGRPLAGRPGRMAGPGRRRQARHLRRGHRRCTALERRGPGRRALLRVVRHQGDADRARVHRLCGRGRARTVEGPVAAGGQCHPQGTARTRRRRAGVPVERADPPPPGDPGRRRASVVPASPAFYAGATHIQDLVDFVAGRVLDAAGVPHRLYRRWEGELGGGSGTIRTSRTDNDCSRRTYQQLAVPLISFGNLFQEPVSGLQESFSDLRIPHRIPLHRKA